MITQTKNNINIKTKEGIFIKHELKSKKMTKVYKNLINFGYFFEKFKKSENSNDFNKNCRVSRYYVKKCIVKSCIFVVIKNNEIYTYK